MRQRSQLTNTSSITSSNVPNTPPIAGFPIITRSHTSPITTPSVHIPHTESVELYVIYKPSTADKTVRLQPQLNLFHIPDPEYTQLPSEISTTSSNTYPNTTSSKLSSTKTS